MKRGMEEEEVDEEGEGRAGGEGKGGASLYPPNI